MAHIEIADELFRQIKKHVSDFRAAEQFVAEAVREKLDWQQRQAKFYELSDETRRRMVNRGISEAEILADFQASREGRTGD